MKQYTEIVVQENNASQQKAIDSFFSEERKAQFCNSGDWYIKVARHGVIRYHCQIQADDYILLHNMLLNGSIVKYTIWSVSVL